MTTTKVIAIAMHCCSIIIKTTPKISTLLQELEGFKYATSLDLNMGYYTIRLDPDAQKICMIDLLWGKYSYMYLIMGIAGSPGIYQEKMSGLIESLNFV